MRIVYREKLDAFSHDLIVMCDLVRDVFTKSSDALLHGSLESAEDALSMADELEEIRQRCEAQAVELLLLETPVAGDLRQIISSIYIVSDFRRMGALAMHIANTARRRHPNIAVPESLATEFEELTRETRQMVDKTREVLTSPEEDLAYQLAAADDHIDDLHHAVMAKVTSNDWDNTSREAVDCALLSRYYERYADHCVAVASRLIYLITGSLPEEDADQLTNPDSDAALLRRFKRLQDPR